MLKTMKSRSSLTTELEKIKDFFLSSFSDYATSPDSHVSLVPFGRAKDEYID